MAASPEQMAKVRAARLVFRKAARWRKERALPCITKCESTGCKRRAQCLRASVPANPHFQAYFKPLDANGVCHQFFDREALQ